jgi:hypothetical protein
MLSGLFRNDGSDYLHTISVIENQSGSGWHRDVIVLMIEAKS